MLKNLSVIFPTMPRKFPEDISQKMLAFVYRILHDFTEGNPTDDDYGRLDLFFDHATELYDIEVNPYRPRTSEGRLRTAIRQYNFGDSFTLAEISERSGVSPKDARSVLKRIYRELGLQHKRGSQTYTREATPKEIDEAVQRHSKIYRKG